MQVRTILIISIYLIGCCAMPVSADFKGMSKISAEKLFGFTKTCKVQPNPLQGGQHLAEFNKVANSLVYFGPSVLCPTLGLLDGSIPFVVSGQAKSRFGKPWYHVTTTDNNPTSGWVPGKYLDLGKSVATLAEKLTEEPEPVPNYTIKDIPTYLVTPSIDLNVRACASTSCKQVSVLAVGSHYTASKRASNGWEYIEVHDGKFGWVNGKYISEVKSIEASMPEMISEEIETRSVKVDPCAQYVKHDRYPNPTVSRASDAFWVKANPQETCEGLVEVKEGQAILVLGETSIFYQIAFLDTDKEKFNKGYIHKHLSHTHYQSDLLPSTMYKAVTTKDKLLVAEQYWESWTYKLRLVWESIRYQFKRQPITMSAISIALLLGLLSIFPTTRKYVLAMFSFFENMLTRRRLGEITSHWHTMIQGLKLSPREFYQTLEGVITSKQISDAKLIDVTWKEGGIFSAKRLYFRVKRKEYAFDICCAPFGNGTFFSYWMGGFPPVILAFFYKIPLISWLAFFFEKAFRPDTYWRNDTMTMFQSLIHSAVLETVDHYTSEKGLKPVATDDRKPKMKQFFDLK